MNHLDLFAGIGGFAIGMPPVRRRFFSEVDKPTISVYQRRFPDAIFLGDIRSIDGERLRREYDGEWIITGGFPCQDISVAGKGAGIAGSRSGLWFEMQRLIRQIRPRAVVAENVNALTVRGLDTVLGSLAEIGYDAEWTCIRASDVGAPHRRERIWIVAYPDGEQPYWSRDERDRRPEFTDSNPVANANGE
jgi:DNA (cytosine-5)-methyltransferase 1